MGLFIEGKPGDFVGSELNGYVFVGTYVDTEIGRVCDVVFDVCDKSYPFYLATSEQNGSWVNTDNILESYLPLTFINNMLKWVNTQPAVLAALTLLDTTKNTTKAEVREELHRRAGASSNVLDWLEHYSQQNQPKNIRSR